MFLFVTKVFDDYIEFQTQISQNVLLKKETFMVENEIAFFSYPFERSKIHY